MIWTKTVPAAPGYYWMREAGKPSTEHRVRISRSDDNVVITRVGIDSVASDDEIAAGKFEFWPEPLQSPRT